MPWNADSNSTREITDCVCVPINNGEAASTQQSVACSSILANVNLLGLRRQQDRHQREGRISYESLDLKMKAITRIQRINIGFSGTHFYMSRSYFVKRKSEEEKV